MKVTPEAKEQQVENKTERGGGKCKEKTETSQGVEENEKERRRKVQKRNNEKRMGKEFQRRVKGKKTD